MTQGFIQGGPVREAPVPSYREEREAGLAALADLADAIDAARERHIGTYPRDLDTTLQGIADRLRAYADDGEEA